MYYLHPTQPAYTVVYPDQVPLQQRRQSAYEEARRRAYEEALYRQALEDELARRRAEEERHRKAYEAEVQRRRAVQEELERQRELEKQRFLELQKQRAVEEELMRRELEMELMRRQKEKEEAEERQKALYAALLEEGLKREKEKEMWRNRVAEKQREMECHQELQGQTRRKTPEVKRAEKPKVVQIPITFIEPSKSAKPAKPASTARAQPAPSTTEAPKSLESRTDPITDFTRIHAARTLQHHFRDTRSKLQTLNNILTELRVAQQNLEQAALSAPLHVTEGKVLAHHNKAFITYEETLMKLIVRADAIQSAGSKTVRDRRKWVVGQVNGALEMLDATRRRAIERWQAEQGDLQKEEPENGSEEMQIEQQIEAAVETSETTAVEETMQMDVPVGSENQNEVQSEAPAAEEGMRVEDAGNAAEVGTEDQPSSVEEAMEVEYGEGAEQMETEGEGNVTEESPIDGPISTVAQSMEVDSADQPQNDTDTDTKQPSADEQTSTLEVEMQDSDTQIPDEMQVEQPEAPSQAEESLEHSSPQADSTDTSMQVDTDAIQAQQAADTGTPISPADQDWTHLPAPSSPERFVVVEKLAESPAHVPIGDCKVPQATESATPKVAAGC